MKNKSVMQHAFSRVPKVSLPRSVFNRSSGHKTTFDAGYLIPIYVDEILPGDTVNLRSTMLIRLLSASLRPFMDNLWVDTFWFFVPDRLIWLSFRRFMGEQANPGDSISFVIPTVTLPDVAAGGAAIGSVADYFGLPTGPMSGGGGTTGLTVNALPFRAWNLIYDQWFRDTNLQNGPTLNFGDGPDTYSWFSLWRRGKRHDYFTSALPFLQKGTAVPIPLGTSAPIVGLGIFQQGSAPGGITVRQTFPSNPTYTGWTVNPAAASGVDALARLGVNQDPANAGWPLIYADLSVAAAATVSSLRQSIALQHFLEQDARGGTRYTEIVKSHFGVTSPDARLQRSELLATSSNALKLHPVSQTAPAAGSYVGQLAGFGTSVQSGNGFTKSFTEHGYVIGIVSVRADLTYQQGQERMWSKSTRYDLFWNEFSGLGEQAILNREIFANVPDGTTVAQKDGVFGYIPRYDEYRFKNSKITGLLRSDATGTLDIWHLSQDFASLPTLGTTFIQDDPPIDRVIAVPAEPHFIMDAFFDVKHARVMPVFGVPGLKKL